MEPITVSREQLLDKRLWAAIGVAIALLLASAWLGIRAYHRGQARQTINSFAAFGNPPLDVQFPQVVASTEGNRSILSAGVNNGIWRLHQRTSDSSTMEVVLTDQGQKWFSVVEKQVIATFKAGGREATTVTSLSEIFP